MNEQPEEIEMPKADQTHLRPVPATVTMQEEDASDAIEGALTKLVSDLQGIDIARNAVEQRGIQYHNQTSAMLIENDERILEVNRAINAEKDLVGKCDALMAQIEAMRKEHGANLAMLEIERQGRLDTIHYLKSNNIG